MDNKKRIRVGAIILYNGKLVSMYRKKENRKFYTFPGGGIEQNETEQNCVIREVYEEFGIKVKPLKKLYTYENKLNIEHFYFCEWIDGKFGTGKGEEFESNLYGLYKPTMINIEDIPKLPLMPPEIANEFYSDYTKNGKTIRNDVKYIKIFK